MCAWYREWLLITYDSPLSRELSPEMKGMAKSDLADRLRASADGMLDDRDKVSAKYRLLLAELAESD